MKKKAGIEGSGGHGGRIGSRGWDWIKGTVRAGRHFNL